MALKAVVADDGQAVPLALACELLGAEVPQGNRRNDFLNLDLLDVGGKVGADLNLHSTGFTVVLINYINVAGVGVVAVLGAIGEGNVPVVAHADDDLAGAGYGNGDDAVLNGHAILSAVALERVVADDGQAVPLSLAFKFFAAEVPQCGRFHRIFTAGFTGFGDFQLEQVVAAIRNAQIVGAGSFQLQGGDVQAVLNGFFGGLHQNFAGFVINGKVTAVAAGDPPNLYGGSSSGGELDGVQHAIGIGLAAKVQTLAGGIAIVKCLGAAVDLGFCAVGDGEIVAHHFGVAICLVARSHSGQVSSGIQNMGVFFCRNQQCSGDHLNHHQQSNDNRKESVVEFCFHCIILLIFARFATQTLGNISNSYHSG